MRINKIICILLAFSFICGCATYLERSEYPRYNQYYPATKKDYEVLSNVTHDIIYGTGSPHNVGGEIGVLLSPIIIPCFLIDLPISITFDTLFFPLDYFDKNSN